MCSLLAEHCLLMRLYLPLARLQILAQVQLFLFIMRQYSRVNISSVLFVYLEDTVNVNQSFCQLFHDVRLVEVRPERDQSVLVLEENVQKLSLSLSIMHRKSTFTNGPKKLECLSQASLSSLV